MTYLKSAGYWHEVVRITIETAKNATVDLLR
jgi:hypothetical protein